MIILFSLFLSYSLVDLALLIILSSSSFNPDHAISNFLAGKVTTGN